jgi:hypothetical protein
LFPHLWTCISVGRLLSSQEPSHCPPRSVSFMRSFEGIVEGCDYEEKPSNDGDDLVSDDGLVIERFSLGEGVYCSS